MSYKVLITCRTSAGSYEGGVALHSVIAEFDTKEEAMAAIKALVTAPAPRFCYEQTTPLFPMEEIQPFVKEVLP